MVVGSSVAFLGASERAGRCGVGAGRIPAPSKCGLGAWAEGAASPGEGTDCAIEAAILAGLD